MRKESNKILINKLQDNLPSIRRIAGYTAEKLAEKIGVTKQTISNIETRRNNTEMTLSQYIAIRTLFDFEIDNNDNQLLKKVINALIDNDDIRVEDYQEIQKVVTTVAATTSGKAKLDPNITFDILIKALPIAAGILVIVLNPKSINWIKRIFK